MMVLPRRMNFFQRSLTPSENNDTQISVLERGLAVHQSKVTVADGVPCCRLLPTDKNNCRGLLRGRIPRRSPLQRRTRQNLRALCR